MEEEEVVVKICSMSYSKDVLFDNKQVTLWFASLSQSVKCTSPKGDLFDNKRVCC